jgi:glutaconate CoA-transferase subunit A
MTNPVATARKELERTDRHVADKTMSAAEALHIVGDGDHVAIGGTNYARTPMALIFELLRQGREGLTLSRALSCYEMELFLASGMAERVVTSWVGIGHSWGLPRVLRHFVEQGLAEYEEWSHLGLTLRYKAGAMGVPFLPTMSMMGSDLMAGVEAKEVRCPYTGQALLAVPSLNPDVALIHVHRADIYGNAQIDGYSLTDVDVSRAAKRVVISAEQIVDSDVIRSAPEKTLIPHFTVDAVVEAPWGAYPHECYGRYEADPEHFAEYVDAVRGQGPEGATAYIARNVTAHSDFQGFLDTVDPERMRTLVAHAEEMIAR